MTVEYGKPIPQLAEAVRNKVTSRIESLVGLRVTEANITVQNVFFPGRRPGTAAGRRLRAAAEQGPVGKHDIKSWLGP
jgi:uncharacterized alkaline shock family protein YloU